MKAARDPRRTTIPTKAIVAGLVVIAIAGGAWWILYPKGEACPAGMNVSGPVIDGTTGNTIGVICAGPKTAP
jgi:hypothetical protein